MQIHALLCVSLASSAVAQLCQANAIYCGWYLSEVIGKYTTTQKKGKCTDCPQGWSNFTTDLQGIWNCNTDQYSATYVEHCAFGCIGPNATCATAPETSTETTTTSTKSWGKPTWTTETSTTTTKSWGWGEPSWTTETSTTTTKSWEKPTWTKPSESTWTETSEGSQWGEDN